MQGSAMTDFTKPTDPLEADLQSDIIDFGVIRGWFIIKVVSPSINGIPDIYGLRRGRHVWIEVKRGPDEEPTEQQKKRHREMKAQGAEVYVVGTLDDARRVLR
jgi:hypothetical protein